MEEQSEFRIRDHLHPAFFVPSTLPISELLKQLQRRRLAMAMVVNEFGEIEGLATLEDLVEEIVGEIRDEYDREERGPVERLPDGSMVIQGSALAQRSEDRLRFALRGIAGLPHARGFHARQAQAHSARRRMGRRQRLQADHRRYGRKAHRQDQSRSATRQ